MEPLGLFWETQRHSLNPQEHSLNPQGHSGTVGLVGWGPVCVTLLHQRGPYLQAVRDVFASEGTLLAS